MYNIITNFLKILNEFCIEFNLKILNIFLYKCITFIFDCQFTLDFLSSNHYLYTIGKHSDLLKICDR